MKHIGRLGLLIAAIVATIASLPQHASSAPPSFLLTKSDFKLVAQPGFGEMALGFNKNTWAWSGAYFNNRVYIGAAPFVACGNILSGPPQPPGNPPPCPPLNALPPNMAGSIWSVDPSVTHPITQTDWVKNYTSPLSVPLGQGMGPLNDGFRGMSVYSDTLTTQQTLFASGVGYGIADYPPSLLGSTDGVTFTDIPQAPGTTMGDINKNRAACSGQNVGMRASAQVGSTFYVVVTGGGGGGTLYASPTPWLGNDTFQAITPPTMCVWEIMPFNGHLYLGTASNAGYGVVRTDCTAAPCSDFTTVIPTGAGLTGNGDNNVESMEVYTDPQGVPHLYVGTGVTPLTLTTAAELTRINPDDTWDLIVGTPRTPPDGILRTPLSGYGEGFNFHQNKYVWRMASYNGALYVGTYNIATSVYVGTPFWQQHLNTIGCNLLGSPDGIHFKGITRNGFNDPYCEGIRSMVSTPYGLFLGGVNDWNGFEVWRGVKSGTTPTPTPRPTQTPTASPTATVTPTSTSMYVPLIVR